MTQDQTLTRKQIADLLESFIDAGEKMNEQALGLIFAIAIRLGISHEELLSEGEQIVEQIKKGENPWKS